jgi:hypothetical protein
LASPYTVWNHWFPCYKPCHLGAYSNSNYPNNTRNSGVLDQFPQLRAADKTIRASRSVRYFEQVDRICRRLAHPLKIMGDVELLTGINTSALDKLFEQSSEIELNNLVSEYQALTSLQTANGFTPPCMTLKEAIKTQIAFFTVEGYKRLCDKHLADRWLETWQRAVLMQNLAQLEQCKAVLQASRYRPEPTTHFEQAAHQYTSRYGETSGLTVNIIGAFPFSKLASETLLADLSVILSHLAPLIRLAQDVRFDPTEKLNVGVFAIASLHGLSLSEAAMLIAYGSFPNLQQQLNSAYQTHLTMTRQTLNSLHNSPQTQAFCTACLHLADQMAQHYPGVEELD